MIAAIDIILVHRLRRVPGNNHWYGITIGYREYIIQAAHSQSHYIIHFVIYYYYLI